MKQDLLGYSATQVRNREVFLLKFAKNFGTFEYQLDSLRRVWARLGKERDTSGQSHAGLLVFANILIRHAIFGFQHIASYQSFLAWLTFRPGLEALLMIGKFLDDPVNAEIWRDRQKNREAYLKAFSGRQFVSKALPRSGDFRRILSRLNDDFMHPNPDFAYRDTTVQEEGRSVTLEVQFFDVSPEVHEAHLLAYLNLMDVILEASEGLVNAFCGPPAQSRNVKSPWVGDESTRATRLATGNPIAKRVMEELGLWQFSHQFDQK